MPKKYLIPVKRKTIKTIRMSNGAVLTGEVDARPSGSDTIYWFRNGKYISPSQQSKYKFFDKNIGSYRTLDTGHYEGTKHYNNSITPVYAPAFEDLINTRDSISNSRLFKDIQQRFPASGKMLTLRTKQKNGNPGKTNLVDIPENMLDSIAVNAGRSGTNFWTDMALIGKESMFDGVSKALGRPYVKGTLYSPHDLTNNHAYLASKEDDTFKQLDKNYDLTTDKGIVAANRHVTEDLKYGKIIEKTPHYSENVMADAFKRYNVNPSGYNHNQGSYIPMVNGIRYELKNEPQLQNYWNTRGKQQYIRGQQEGLAHGGFLYAEGGEMKKPSLWDDLSLEDKSEVMASAVRNGLTTLPEIRDKWNEFANGGHLFVRGGAEDDSADESADEDTPVVQQYVPSDYIKGRIAYREGSSMKTNRSFEAEARDFNKAIPQYIQRELSPAQLDSLYSYGYNVGMGALKQRVRPMLERYIHGDATAEDVAGQMIGRLDSKYRGLRERRKEEQQMFINNPKTVNTGDTSYFDSSAFTDPADNIIFTPEYADMVQTNSDALKVQQQAALEATQPAISWNELFNNEQPAANTVQNTDYAYSPADTRQPFELPEISPLPEIAPLPEVNSLAEGGRMKPHYLPSFYDDTRFQDMAYRPEIYAGGGSLGHQYGFGEKLAKNTWDSNRPIDNLRVLAQNWGDALKGAFVDTPVALGKAAYNLYTTGNVNGIKRGQFNGGTFSGSGAKGSFDIEKPKEPKDFNEAYDQAVANKQNTFWFRGLKYNTDKENNPIRELNNREVGAGRKNSKKPMKDYDYEAGIFGLPGKYSVLNLMPMVTERNFLENNQHGLGGSLGHHLYWDGSELQKGNQSPYLVATDNILPTIQDYADAQRAETNALLSGRIHTTAPAVVRAPRPYRVNLSPEEYRQNLLTVPRDNVFINNGEVQNPQLAGRTKEENKLDTAIGLGVLGAMTLPFTAPLAVGGGSAAIANAGAAASKALANNVLGTGAKSLLGRVLTNPYVDTGLTSVGGADAINDIYHGKANAITGLEIMPLVGKAVSGIANTASKFSQLSRLEKNYTGVPHKLDSNTGRFMDEQFPNIHNKKTVWTSDDIDYAKTFNTNIGDPDYTIFDVYTDPKEISVLETPKPSEGQMTFWHGLPYRLNNGQVTYADNINVVKNHIPRNKYISVNNRKTNGSYFPDDYGSYIYKDGESSHILNWERYPGTVSTDDVVKYSASNGYNATRFHRVNDGSVHINGDFYTYPINELVLNPNTPKYVLPHNKPKWFLWNQLPSKYRQPSMPYGSLSSMSFLLNSNNHE